MFLRGTFLPYSQRCLGLARPFRTQCLGFGWPRIPAIRGLKRAEDLRLMVVVPSYTPTRRRTDVTATWSWPSQDVREACRGFAGSL
jgi:hypothetical protein